MGRLLIVSNRLPVNVTRTDGQLHFHRSVGGLATGMASLSRSDQLWIGWPGLAGDTLTDEDKTEILRELTSLQCHPVHLSSQDIRDYYYGFCNKTVWPLFHYFPQFCVFEPSLWTSYESVNRYFCDEVLKVAEPDDTIWIHDYQLMLLPRLVREKLPGAQIGFFLHIPFPSFELLRLLPWRMELLEGLLGADLLGFHEYDYVRHFLSSAHRIAGHEHTLNTLAVEDRLVKVDAYPMGIDYDKFAGSLALDSVREEIQTIRDQFHGRKLVISIDRLDYTKGILHRLEAFDWFLTNHPEWREKVSLILLAVPSRTEVDMYKDLRNQIEGLVGRINGAYSTIDWTPIQYLYRSLPFEKLVALYHAADVALITPLRDGMNLVAKEYVAAKAGADEPGMLILSEMAGAASELGEALIINPHHKARIVQAIVQALDMPADEQRKRNAEMQTRLSRYTVQRWAHDFIDGLEDIKETQHEMLMRKLTRTAREDLLRRYRIAEKRLLLLDYDGTLVEFTSQPDTAEPNPELRGILAALVADGANEVVVISGRDRYTLSDWLGEMDLNIVAEHGNWIRPRGRDWTCKGPGGHDWKETIRPILDRYVERTPGSFIEEKDFSLVWHYRRTDPELGRLRTQELRDAVMSLTENLDLGVFEGSKIIEIKSIAANKGAAVSEWIDRDWDLIFCVGDDYTDEEMFAMLDERQAAFTVKVGRGSSRARYSVANAAAIRSILQEMTS